MKNIYLSGFMASGKSTIGRALAKKLKRRHVDTDALIESETGLKVSEIFERHGEAEFRKLESGVLQKFASSTDLVVSLGGGLILAEENRALLKKGTWIFLDVPFATLKARLKKSRHRPLANTSEVELQTRFETRLPLYREAEFIVACENLERDEVCEKILELVEK